MSTNIIQKTIKKEIPAVTGMILTWMFLIRDWLKRDVSWSDFLDNTNFISPLMASISRNWQSSGAPLFTSEIVGAFPLFANPHFNVKYPFYFLWTSNFKSPLETSLFLHKLVILHLFILLINTYLLSRALKLAPSISAMIGIGFTLGPAVLPSMYWVTITAATSWMPAVFAGIILILSGSLRGGFCVLVATGSLQVYAMPAQVFAITVASSALIVCSWMALSLLNKNNIAQEILVLCASILSIAALCGPYIWNVAKFHADSIRWIGKVGPPLFGPDALLPKIALSEYAFKARDLLQFFYGINNHVIAGNILLGSTVVLFAGTALCFAIKKKNYIIASFGMCSTIFFAFTFNWFANNVNYYLPLINKVREVSWFGLSATLTTLIMAGFGLQQLQSIEVVKIKHKITLTASSILIFLIPTFFLNNHQRSELRADLLLSFISCVFVAISFWLFNTRRAKQLPAYNFLRFYSPLLAFVFALYPLHIPNPPKLATNEINSVEAKIAHSIIGNLAKNSKGFRDFRTDFPKGTAIDWSMAGLYHGTKSFQGYVSPQNFRTFDLLYHIKFRPNASLVAGLRYRIRKSIDEPPENHAWKQIFCYGEWTIEENQLAFPRLYLAKRFAGEYDPNDPNSYWTQVESKQLEPGDVFFPVNSAYRPAAFNSLQEGDRLTGELLALAPPIVTTSDNESITANVVSKIPLLLILNEYASKEWVVFVNNYKSKIYNVNLTQIAVYLPPGKSEVKFIYRPLIFGITLYVWSLIGYIAVAIVMIGLSYKRLRTRWPLPC